MMHLQVDREFQQNVIKKLNSGFNFEMFRQFKKPLFKSKKGTEMLQQKESNQKK